MGELRVRLNPGGRKDLLEVYSHNGTCEIDTPITIKTMEALLEFVCSYTGWEIVIVDPNIPQGALKVYGSGEAEKGNFRASCRGVRNISHERLLGF